MRLPKAELNDEIGQLGNHRFNLSQIGIQGFSLGSAITESVTAYASKYGFPYAFQAAAMVAPTHDLVHTAFHSPKFQPLIRKQSSQPFTLF